MEIKRSMLRQAATADGQEILGGLAMLVPPLPAATRRAASGASGLAFIVDHLG